jgi:hypothetical protein
LSTSPGCDGRSPRGGETLAGPRRGGGTLGEHARSRPDVRYGRYENDDDGGGVEAGDGGTACPSSKRWRTGTGSDVVVRNGGGSGIRVFTSRSLPMGSALHMTYGAKGNASLLGRYGFAIPDNVEPDGEPPPRSGMFSFSPRNEVFRCVSH